MKTIFDLIKKQSLWYYLSLFLLALAAVATTIIPMIFSLPQTWGTRLHIASGVLYFIFFLDFFYFLKVSGNRRDYVRDNWISLVALLVPPVKGLKAFKGIKGLKGLKGLKGAKILKTLKLGKKVKTHIDAESGQENGTEKATGV